MKSLWVLEDDNQMNIKVDFILHLAKLSDKVLIRIAAADVFRLTVNEELVGYGPRRIGKGLSALNEYRIENLFQKDINEIKIEVLSYKNDGFYLADEKPFFACEILHNGRKIASSEDFMAFLDKRKKQKVYRYSIQRNFVESYNFDSSLYMEAHLKTVTGNKIETCDLPYPTFKKQSGELIEKGKIKTLKNFNKFPVPFTIADKVNIKKWKDDELEEDVINEISAFTYYRNDNYNGKDKYITYSLPYAMTGFVNIKAKAKTKCKIYLIFDETLNTEFFRFSEKIYSEYYFNDALPIYFHRLNTINIIKYEMGEGENDFCSIEPYTMKYLRIIIIGDAEIENFDLIKYENDDAYKLNLNINDKQISEIFTAAQRTFAQCSVDFLVDCPSRERAAWLCDSYFSGQAEWALTGNNRIEKNTLKAFLSLPEGHLIPKYMIPMCCFQNELSDEYMPTWALWFVVELGAYAERTKDFRFIKKFKNKVVALIDGLINDFLNEYYLLENLKGWVFIEWSKANDFTSGINFPANMLFYKTLKTAARLFDIKSYNLLADKVKRSIIDWSFNGEFFEDNIIRENKKLIRTGNISETCQYYAFQMGIADKKEFSDLFDILLSSFGKMRNDKTTYPNVYKSNAFIGNYLRLDYLANNGMQQKAIEESREYLYYMVERTGTLWEHDTPIGSLVHCFAAIVAVWIKDLWGNCC